MFLKVQQWDEFDLNTVKINNLYLYLINNKTHKMKNLESGYYWLIDNETSDKKVSLFDSEMDCWTFCGSDLFNTTDDILLEYTIANLISEPV